MNTKYMVLAIEEAKKGIGWTNPNPIVGAVIVKNNKIIGIGYHQKYGSAHAEVNAINNSSESTQGADMYVTLEPCCHYGKQPPCTDAIIRAGIKNVYVGSFDPNPLVSGKGLKLLKQNGINVQTEILKKECDKLNEVFFYYIKTSYPYVVSKYAMTMDGKIATQTGSSKWITGEEARNYVQLQRHKLSAIMVGVGTVIKDNPMLTCRIEGLKSPIRIICDTNLKTPLESYVVKTAKTHKTIIATCSSNSEVQKKYIDKGCVILNTPKKNNMVDLKYLMKKLGELKIDSILLEGGAELNWSMFSQGLVNRVQVFISPKIVGGKNAISPVGGKGVDEMNNSLKLINSNIVKIGEDFLIDSEVENVYRNN